MVTKLKKMGRGKGGNLFFKGFICLLLLCSTNAIAQVQAAQHKDSLNFIPLKGETETFSGSQVLDRFISVDF